MKHVLVVLTLAITGILIWTYKYHPQEWKSWTLQVEREFATLTNTDRADIEEKWFVFQRNLLLSQYADAEKEYEQSKLDLENQFGEVKKQKESNGADDTTIDSVVADFQEKIEEKKLLFEQRKAEIEAQIADIKRRYEETRATLEALNNSVKKVREGVTESVDAIDDLRGSVQN